MRLDWSVVWSHREALLQGALVTVLLTALTMLIAVPGGIVLMLLRQSRLRLLRGIGTAIVEFFRNLPLILLVYWAYYVVPILVEAQDALAAAGVRLVLLSSGEAAAHQRFVEAGLTAPIVLQGDNWLDAFKGVGTPGTEITDGHLAVTAASFSRF